MTADIRPKHRRDAETVLDLVLADGARGDGIDRIAQALAEAEEYGVQRALYRLGPRISNLYAATIDLGGEVGL